VLVEKLLKLFFSVVSSCAVCSIDVSSANSLPRPNMSSAISFIKTRNNKVEQIAFKYIFNHLLFNSLLYKFQSGFIPGYSTTHQLVELYHNIMLALDNKEMTSITFADVSKALDRISIRGLFVQYICSRMKGETLVYSLTAKTCCHF
jgi:hypothetical protein